MIVLRPDRTLFEVRYAYSPLWETLAAVRCVLYPDKHTLHARWARSFRELRSSFGILADLLPRRGWSPNFLVPPPAAGTRPTFEAELERVRRTDGDTVRGELHRIRTDPSATRRIQAAANEPDLALAELARILEEAHRGLIEPIWSQLQAQLEKDIDHRASLMVTGGLPAVLADLSPEVTFDDDSIHVRSAETLVRHLDGRGLLLIPSTLSWPTVTAYTEAPWQPAIVYRSRGAGELWLEANGPDNALGLLLGRRRAMILDLLCVAQSTTSLAHVMGISPATVSEHLRVLHGAGLVTRRRHGREQLYKQTPMARDLIKGSSSRTPHDCDDVGHRS